MTTTQLTLVQIGDYGPWTVNTGLRREADLQTLQARLFADLAQFVGSRDADAFFTRFDDVVAVTNLLEHMRGTTDAVPFFIGGDRLVAVSPPLDRESDTDVVEHVGGATGVELQVGGGHGSTARDAGAAAKRTLDGCRENDSRIERTPSERSEADR